MIDTNVKGLLYVTRAVAPLWLHETEDIFSILVRLPERSI